MMSDKRTVIIVDDTIESPMDLIERIDREYYIYHLIFIFNQIGNAESL